MKSTAKKTTPYTGGQPTLEQLAEHDAQWRRSRLDLLTKIAGKRPVPPNTLEKKIAVLGKWLKYFEDGTEQRLVLVDDIRSAVRDLVGKSVPTHMLYPAERKPMDKQMTRDKSLVFKRLVKVIDCCFVAAESLVSLSDTESDYTARRAKNTLQTIIYPEVGQWTQYCILLNVS